MRIVDAKVIVTCPGRTFVSTTVVSVGGLLYPGEARAAKTVRCGTGDRVELVMGRNR